MSHNDNFEERSDTKLVEAVQRGEPACFEPLLDRHLGHLRVFIALKAPVPHLIDEITHETFVFAFHNIASFTAGTNLRAWLRAIAGNLIRAEVQRYAREQANKLTYAERHLLDVALEKPGLQASREAEFLQQCLEEVPDAMRQLLALKYHDDCTSDDMARRLQRSTAWVRTTLFRLRQQLKECVEAKLIKERPC